MPNWLLVPGILVLSIVGVYSTHASVFSILLMLAIGMVGWLLRKAGFDMGPCHGSEPAQRARISGGDVAILFQSKISIILWILAIAMAVLPLVAGRRSKSRALAKAVSPETSA